MEKRLGNSRRKLHCFQVKYRFGYIKGLQQIDGDPNGLKVFMLQITLIEFTNGPIVVVI